MQESEPSKSEDDNRGDPGKMKKTIDELLQKVVKSKWKNHGATRPFSDDVVTYWMTIEVSGRYLSTVSAFAKFCKIDMIHSLFFS